MEDDDNVYKALIKAWAYATSDKYGETDATTITMDEVIKRWKKRNNGLTHDNRYDTRWNTNNIYSICSI